MADEGPKGGIYVNARRAVALQLSMYRAVAERTKGPVLPSDGTPLDLDAALEAIRGTCESSGGGAGVIQRGGGGAEERAKLVLKGRLRPNAAVRIWPSPPGFSAVGVRSMLIALWFESPIPSEIFTPRNFADVTALFGVLLSGRPEGCGFLSESCIRPWHDDARPTTPLTDADSALTTPSLAPICECMPSWMQLLQPEQVHSNQIHPSAIYLKYFQSYFST